MTDRPPDAREIIFARIRDALRDQPPATPIPRRYHQTAPASIDVVELFADRVADYRATVVRTSRGPLAADVAATLQSRGARRVAAPPDLPAEWLVSAAIELVADEPPLSVSVLDRLDGVITGCAIAIAETGTIVLDAGPGQGRRVLSLLPDYHLCVVFAEQIVGSVPEAVARLDPRRPMTWISGPSATSDIELQRVEGVHGPRTLDVIVVGLRSRPTDHEIALEATGPRN